MLCPFSIWSSSSNAVRSWSSAVSPSEREEIIIEFEIKGLSLLCSTAYRAGAQKERAPEWREGFSFYRPPRRARSQPSARDLDVSPPPEPTRWLFIRPVLPPFISHYETQLLGIRREKTAQETEILCFPCLSWPWHSCTPSSRWARSGSPVSRGSRIWL